MRSCCYPYMFLLSLPPSLAACKVDHKTSFKKNKKIKNKNTRWTYWMKKNQPFLWGEGSSHCQFVKLKIRKNSKTSASWRRPCSWVKFNRGKSVSIGVVVHHTCLVFNTNKYHLIKQFLITCILLADLLRNELLPKNIERVTIIFKFPHT